jgi:hypothetical protein
MSYRILSPCGGLGYGFPEASFRTALQKRLNLIAADAGSVDPGPYYLGKGVSYMEEPQTRRDFSFLLEGVLQQQCPLIIGSCGLAGDTPNLEFMVNIVKNVFNNFGVKDIRVAVIHSHIDSNLLIGRINDLKPVGNMPPLKQRMMEKSAIVGQMGIAPFIKALDEGAQVILAGRACDVAIFAADPIRRGIDPGLAFHAGHILECGAMASEPSSGMDCLIADFLDDETVIFTAPNKNRKTTVQSIAAHSLFEESHPALHYYPEGVLSFQKTKYFQHNERSAGIKNSVFINRPLSIKLEGSEKVGQRIISFLFCKNATEIPDEFVVYGRNGVEAIPIEENESEIGLLVKVISGSQNVVEPIATILKSYFLHFDYPGRISTAGNMAFPLSPSQINYQDNQGQSVCLFIGGTRDPYFQKELEKIKSEALKSVKREFSDLTDQYDIEISVADRSNPLLFLETIGKTIQEALRLHKEKLSNLERFLDDSQSSIFNIVAGEAYSWNVYHTIEDEKLIKEQHFPIHLFHCNGSNWEFLKEERPIYEPIGSIGNDTDINEQKIDAIKRVEHGSKIITFKPLIEMSNVIRSKNAGVNRITFEVYFKTDQEYWQAVRSNVFEKAEIAKTLQIPLERMIGSFQADACNAIKISAYRDIVSGTPGDRDVFGAQQHSKLLSLRVPIYS